MRELDERVEEESRGRELDERVEAVILYLNTIYWKIHANFHKIRYQILVS